MVACGNARWLGTRILPLAMSALVTFCGNSMVGPLTFLFFGLFLSFGLLGLLAMYRSSQETFENGIRRIAPGGGVRNDWSRTIVLTVSSITTAIAAILIPTNFTSRNQPYHWITTDVDANGDLWYVQLERSFLVARAKINSNPDLMLIEKVTAESPFREWDKDYIQPVHTAFAPLPFGPEIVRSADGQSQRLELVYDPRGFILAYSSVIPGDRTSRPTLMLSYIVSQDRVSRTMEPRGKPFKEKPIIFSRNWFVTRDGVYWFDSVTGTVKQMVSKQVDCYAVESRWDGKAVRANPSRLFLFSGSKLHEYHPPLSLMSQTDSLEPEATIDMGANVLEGLGSLRYTSKDDFTLIQKQAKSDQIFLKRPGKELERFVSSAPKGMEQDSASPSALEQGLTCMALPLASLLVLGLIILIAVFGFGTTPPDLEQDGGLAIVVGSAFIIAIQAVLACAFAYSAARHRGLSKRASLWWAFGGAMGGFGIALAITAIFPRCFRETCSNCKTKRRVELLTCEHCGHDWDLPACEGIEVLEKQTEQVALAVQ